MRDLDKTLTLMSDQQAKTLITHGFLSNENRIYINYDKSKIDCDIRCCSDVNIYSTLHADGNLRCEGLYNITSGGEVIITKNLLATDVDVSGNLTVNGDCTFRGDAEIYGVLTVHGNLTYNVKSKFKFGKLILDGKLITE